MHMCMPMSMTPLGESSGTCDDALALLALALTLILFPLPPGHHSSRSSKAACSRLSPNSW